MNNSPVADAFFAPFADGPASHRFCQWWAPRVLAPLGLVVHVHAFGEEMNKSRRMVAQQARRLAEAGYAVLGFDLLGCGDSAGDFGDATWDAWLQDVAQACALAQSRWQAQWPQSEPPQQWLWAHRVGALLAGAALGRQAQPWHLLLWQPTPQGKTVLAQFLRLESAGALMGKAQQGGKPTARQLLAAGQPAEVAGYRLNPLLTSGLEAAKLLPPAAGTRVEWIDVAAQADAQPTPVAQTAVEAMRAAGCQVRHHLCQGPSFWQTTEIEDAPALWPLTLQALAAAPLAAVSPASPASPPATAATAAPAPPTAPETPA